ncbi:MAG: sulfatase-like hydrolase/transferase [Syntrophobacteraceae bacterium]
MPKEPSDRSKPSEVNIDRRKFLKQSGAALVSGVALSPLSALAGAGGDSSSPSSEEHAIPERVSERGWRQPNLVLLITDQERYPQHWPKGWADANLPNRKRIADHGLTFTHAFCASSMCTPSRATLFTGLYPPEHKVDQTLRYGTGDTAVDQPTLQPDLNNMAKMLASAGYNVQYRGKWHISKDPSGTQEIVSSRDLDHYGFKGWVPPEGGADQNPSGFGGGTTNYDEWYASRAAHFLKNIDPLSQRPFALIVCLINPHDVMSYPGKPRGSGWNSKSYSDIPPYRNSNNYGDVDLDAPPLDQIGLPKNFEPEDFKPTAQAQSTHFWDAKLGRFLNDDDRRRYLRFYAYLHIESDKHIGTVLDALYARPGLKDNTIVIRLADHGEMGLSHGGMRQKAYSAYEETIHVPLVISNPRLFPKPVRTSALASLVDLMPTLATIADVPDRRSLTFRGTDLTPVIVDAVINPDIAPRPVQDSVLFTTDEILASLTKPPYVTEPSHVRCLREARWKIVMYFDPDSTKKQYELYDLLKDPLERHNMADPDNKEYYNREKLLEMAHKLRIKMKKTHTAPGQQ